MRLLPPGLVSAVPTGTCAGRLTGTERAQGEAEAREEEELASWVLLHQHVTCHAGLKRLRGPGFPGAREPVLRGLDVPSCSTDTESDTPTATCAAFQRRPGDAGAVQATQRRPRSSRKGPGWAPEASSGQGHSPTPTRTQTRHAAQEEQLRLAAADPGQWGVTSLFRRVQAWNYQ